MYTLTITQEELDALWDGAFALQGRDSVSDRDAGDLAAATLRRAES